MAKKEIMVKKTSFSLKDNAAPQNKVGRQGAPANQVKDSSTVPLKDKGWSKDWKKFLAVAEEMKNSASSDNKGVQIWLDANLKMQLEMLRASGMKYPVRQLLNAAVRVFLENCSGDVKRQLENLKSIG